MRKPPERKPPEEDIRAFRDAVRGAKPLRHQPRVRHRPKPPPPRARHGGNLP